MRRIILSILCGISVLPASPQEILTLERCKELALKNNAQMNNAELAIGIAEQQKKEAFTKYFPSVSGMATGIVFSKPLMTTEVATGYPAPNDKVQVELLKNTLIAGVAVMQPVFAGGQIILGNRLAKTGVEISRLQKQLAENEVLLATERYFWQLVSLKEKMKTIANSEALLGRILSDVQAATEAGLTTRNDLLRVELEQNRLASNKLKAENGLQMLKKAFAQHIGLENNAFDIRQPDVEPSLSLAGECPGGVEHRPEYQLLEKSADAARMQLRMETGKRLPAIAIGAGYNWVKMDVSRQTEQTKGFGVALVAVSMPISDWWGGSYAIRRKKLEWQQAENTKREKADLLQLQMQQTGNELNEAYQQILLAKKSISAAEENLRISHDNFNAGLITLSELLEAQNLVQQANDQYAEATAGYFVKLAEYKKNIHY